MSIVHESRQQLHLRVLYTINSSPQYVLARSPVRVPIELCESTVAKIQIGDEPVRPQYGQAPLKACLSAICNSSPELLLDASRDFSLYVLDPLEALSAPSQVPHASDFASAPRGVAVALGLMSWALESDQSESRHVSGTIVNNSVPGMSTLEVIFALRETKRVQKAALSNALNSWGRTPGPGLSHNPMTQFPDSSSHIISTAPYSCVDQMQPQTLTRASDFPELYVGPPRRARGRPEGSTSKSKQSNAPSRSPACTSQGSLAQDALVGTNSRREATHPTLSSPMDDRVGFKEKSNARTKQKAKHRAPRPRPPPSRPPFICAPLRPDTSLSQNQHPSHSRTQMCVVPQQQRTSPQPQTPSESNLLALLSTISSNVSSSDAIEGSQAAQNTVLLSALRDLVVANPHLLRFSGTGINPDQAITDNNRRRQATAQGCSNEDADDTDSDIILLDSTTVDTSAFRRRISGFTATDEISDADTDTPAPRSTQNSQPAPGSSHDTATSPRPQNGSLPAQGGAHTVLQSASPPDEVISPSSPIGRRPSFTSSARPSLRSSSSWPRSYSTGSSLDPSLSFSKIETQPAALVLNPDKSEKSHFVSTKRLKNTTTPLVAPAATMSRKRTLGEFMAEREARDREKPKKRMGSRRATASEVPQKANQMPLSSTVGHTRSSPPRALFRSGSSSIATSAASSTFSRSTPLTSNSAAMPGTSSRQNFVLPAWARTDTAMLPRLSQEALARRQAEEEAKRERGGQKRREDASSRDSKRRRADRSFTGRRQEDLAKESSNDDDNDCSRDIRSQPPASNLIIHTASASLPVFASDTAAPISFSPSRSERPLSPITPPRQSRVSGSYPTPSKVAPGSGSLFTPSGKVSSFSPTDGSLFTPATHGFISPITTPTPRSRLAESPCRRRPISKTPRRITSQTPRTPNGEMSFPRTPRKTYRATLRSWNGSVRKRPQSGSPSSRISCGGTSSRMLLCPPASPCTQRSPGKAGESSQWPSSPSSSAIKLDPQHTPSTCIGKVERVVDRTEEDKLSRELDEALLGVEVPMQSPHGAGEGVFVSHVLDTGSLRTEGERSMGHPDSAHYPRNERRGDDAGDNSPRDDNSQCILSSPLPPSSPPPPTSPFSSPVKNSNLDECDLLPEPGLLSVSGPDRPEGVSWLSETDSTWLTETEGAWLTDTEGGQLLSDSDAAWLSDSDAIFGDVSSIPPSSTSSWLSDRDSDPETTVAHSNANRILDPNAFDKAFAAFTDVGQINVGSRYQTDTFGIAYSEFWESLRPLLQSNGKVDDARDRARER